MRKIFYVYAASGDSLESGVKAALNLPATPYEIMDAMDKLRISERNSGTQFQVEVSYRFDTLAAFLYEPADLYELNALAQKLSELDDGQAVAFKGLLAMAGRPKGMFLELPKLIDLAYSTDCCHVVGEVLNDFQLGRFCAENGFLPGAEDLPDELFDLLDFERIGREHRQREGGVIVKRTAEYPGGYVERHSDLVEAYKTLDLTPKAPDYAILLEVSKGFFNDPVYDNDRKVQLKLPAAPEELDAVLTALDAWDWQEVGWSCLDCKIPSLMEMISDNEDSIDFLSHMAQQLADMDPKQVAAYKALLSAADCQTLQQAEQLMGTLDDYIFSPEYSSPVELAKGELSVILCSIDQERIEPHLNLHQYGQALIERSGGMLTKYGMIERKDGQPIQAEQSQRGGMEMM